jgi:hypothetical protein
MSSIIRGKKAPRRPSRAVPRKDYFRGSYLSTAPLVTREQARDAARTILAHEPHDATARALMDTLGITEVAR